MIVGYSRKFAAMPTTGLTAWFDFSDISTLYKTSTIGNNPAYTNVATADADVIQIARSIYPVATSDYTFPYGSNNDDPSKSPVLRLTTPLLGSACLDFDGSNDHMFLANRTAGPVQNADIITQSAFTIIVSFRCESLPPSNGNFQPLFADATGAFYWGLYLYNQSGTVKLLVQNYDGTYDNAFAADALSADTNYVAMGRHESGNIYASINGGTEASVASGSTADPLTGVGSYLGAGGDASRFNGRIGEIAVWNIALTGDDLTNALAYFVNKWI